MGIAIVCRTKQDVKFCNCSHVLVPILILCVFKRFMNVSLSRTSTGMVLVKCPFHFFCPTSAEAVTVEKRPENTKICRSCIQANPTPIHRNNDSATHTTKACSCSNPQPPVGDEVKPLFAPRHPPFGSGGSTLPCCHEFWFALPLG